MQKQHLVYLVLIVLIGMFISCSKNYRAEIIYPNVNMRENPRPESKIIDVVNEGSTLIVLKKYSKPGRTGIDDYESIVNSWKLIETEDHVKGWVISSFALNKEEKELYYKALTHLKNTSSSCNIDNYVLSNIKFEKDLEKDKYVWIVEFSRKKQVDEGVNFLDVYYSSEKEYIDTISFQ